MSMYDFLIFHNRQLFPSTSSTALINFLSTHYKDFQRFLNLSARVFDLRYTVDI